MLEIKISVSSVFLANFIVSNIFHWSTIKRGQDFGDHFFYFSQANTLHYQMTNRIGDSYLDFTFLIPVAKDLPSFRSDKKRTEFECIRKNHRNLWHFEFIAKINNDYLNGRMFCLWSANKENKIVFLRCEKSRRCFRIRQQLRDAIKTEFFSSHSQQCWCKSKTEWCAMEIWFVFGFCSFHSSPLFSPKTFRQFYRHENTPKRFSSTNCYTISSETVWLQVPVRKFVGVFCRQMWITYFSLSLNSREVVVSSSAYTTDFSQKYSGDIHWNICRCLTVAGRSSPEILFSTEHNTFGEPMHHRHIEWQVEIWDVQVKRSDNFLRLQSQFLACRFSNQKMWTWKSRHSDSKPIEFVQKLWNILQRKIFYFHRGKVVMPQRITHPWLLFDVVYKMTDTASAELNQKKKLDTFTRKVSSLMPSKTEWKANK